MRWGFLFFSFSWDHGVVLLAPEVGRILVGGFFFTHCGLVKLVT